MPPMAQQSSRDVDIQTGGQRKFVDGRYIIVADPQLTNALRQLIANRSVGEEADITVASSSGATATMPSTEVLGPSIPGKPVEEWLTEQMGKRGLGILALREGVTCAGATLCHKRMVAANLDQASELTLARDAVVVFEPGWWSKGGWSTGAKVAVGVAAVTVVGLVGLAVYKTRKK